MALLLVALLVLLALSISAVLLVNALRRRPYRPWVELSLIAVFITNLGTTVPGLLGRATDPPPWLMPTAMAAWLVLLFVFPNGRAAPRWTGWVLVSSLSLTLSTLLPGIPSAVAGATFVAAFAIGIGSQIWRYQRRSAVPERQATKWLLAGLVPASTLFLGIGAVVSTTSLDSGLFDALWYRAASLLAIWLVPVAGALGVLLRDWGRIDDVVHSTIVICGVGLSVAWAYFLVLPAFGPTWGACVAAALVLPMRWMMSRLATNIVYGRDASSAVVMLERRLETSVRAEDVAGVVAHAMVDGLALPYAAVAVDGGLAAEAGALQHASAPSLEHFPVAYLGSAVGEIIVAPRAGDASLSRRDRQAVARLAAAAGPALHGARTLQELSRARERLVLAREEERRRLRRDLHDDLAPTLAGLGLRAAAAASLGSVDSERAGNAHDDLQLGIQAAIAQVREIAYDLRPPVLDDHGLQAAIRARLAVASDPALRVEVEVHDLPSPMPAAVEVAVLRIVQEAVTNVRRHSGATKCWVRLRGLDGRLHVEVTDDGCGIPSGQHRGVGLLSIEERAQELGGASEVVALETGGTRVSVTLPTREGEGW